jgi:hypothetical protein
MQLDPFNEITNFSPLQNFEDLFRDPCVRPIFGNFEAEPHIKKRSNRLVARPDRATLAFLTKMVEK